LTYVARVGLLATEFVFRGYEPYNIKCGYYLFRFVSCSNRLTTLNSPVITTIYVSVSTTTYAVLVPSESRFMSNTAPPGEVHFLWMDVVPGR